MIEKIKRISQIFQDILINFRFKYVFKVNSCTEQSISFTEIRTQQILTPPAKDPSNQQVKPGYCLQSASLLRETS